ncbi:AraC family transcriptional regulator [Streptomyces sp. A7024]|uniref:AraC family transcriptional regulator n=1 Tax=Streptomyces coryli TaxID=1128680 RepID=A0A6G4TYU4_9ACTN|nr:AraC family transcriptional regulator [Streptomyces coryli]NGN64993.1 AraC family transcriptional regulator [Streptomyces coryli]
MTAAACSDRREHAAYSRAALGTGGEALGLLTACFTEHRFAPHSHDEFSIGMWTGGLEVIDYRGGQMYAGPGTVVVLAPGEMHTGRPAGDDGYAYRAFYPRPELFTDGTRGAPHFTEGVFHDPELADRLTAAHREISRSADPLEAESRVPWLLTALARRHGRAGTVRDALPGAGELARAVRDRLADSVLAPPSLADIGCELGLSRYQVLRVFRDAMGLPPYAWLAQHRVARARGLLEAGRTPAEAAALVGFADQAHLTRWFRRVMGVTPGAYRNSVQDGVPC